MNYILPFVHITVLTFFIIQAFVLQDRIRKTRKYVFDITDDGISFRHWDAILCILSGIKRGDK